MGLLAEMPMPRLADVAPGETDGSRPGLGRSAVEGSTPEAASQEAQLESYYQQVSEQLRSLLPADGLALRLALAVVKRARQYGLSLGLPVGCSYRQLAAIDHQLDRVMADGSLRYRGRRIQAGIHQLREVGCGEPVAIGARATRWNLTGLLGELLPTFPGRSINYCRSTTVVEDVTVVSLLQSQEVLKSKALLLSPGGGEGCQRAPEATGGNGKPGWQPIFQEWGERTKAEVDRMHRMLHGEQRQEVQQDATAEAVGT